MTKVAVVGGPISGMKVDRPQAKFLIVPIPEQLHWPMADDGGISNWSCKYSVRRARTPDGELVELLAPDGEPVAPEYLALHKLTIES
jgi:hypothetical protein